MIDQEVIRERWTLKAQVDVLCAQCQAAGVEMRMVIPVEVRLQGGRLRLSHPDPQDQQPVEVECLSCGAVVKYGETGQVLRA